MYKNKTVALALGGGGTCGLAHIGVLKALEEHGIIPDYICGTSMGSVVGALYANGLTPDEMMHECRKLRFLKLFDINPLIVKNNYLVTGKLVEKILRNLTQEKTIDQLNIKYSCVAADLVSGEEYEFTSGPVWLGVRASVSIPGIFKPVEHDNKILVDGGVLNNVPVKQLEKYNPDIIIACDVLSEYVMYSHPKRIWDIMLYSFNLLQYKHESIKLKKIKYKILPNTTHVNPLNPTLKFLDKLYEEGYIAAQKTIKKLEKDFK